MRGHAIVATCQSQGIHNLKKTCFIIVFTLNRTIVYKTNIMPCWRLETNVWDHELVRKQFTGVINQAESCRVSFSWACIQLDFFFETSWGASCWPLERMPVKGTSSLASLFKPIAPSIFLTWVEQMGAAWLKRKNMFSCLLSFWSSSCDLSKWRCSFHILYSWQGEHEFVYQTVCQSIQ